MNKRIYLDHNASSPVRPEVKTRMMEVLDIEGNPSSVHMEGRGARAVLEQARETVSSALPEQLSEVIFTSGGTEAANLALYSKRGKQEPDYILVAATEHACVLEGAMALGKKVEVLPVREDGMLCLTQLEAQLQKRKNALVCVMAANNETGIIQPMGEISACVRSNNALLFCDAVQALGKLDITTLDADIVSLSAHKIGGAQGVGAVILGRDIDVTPQMIGGGQEMARRAGTPNLAAIAGFALAIELCEKERISRMAELGLWRDEMEDLLSQHCEDIVIFGKKQERLPNTSCFAIPNFSSEALLMALDLAGFSVSSGSACSSGKISKSHVLAAMAVDEHLSGNALRVSFGWNSRKEDGMYFAHALTEIIHERGRRSYG